MGWEGLGWKSCGAAKEGDEETELRCSGDRTDRNCEGSDVGKDRAQDEFPMVAALT